jgi:hypothetical protein
MQTRKLSNLLILDVDIENRPLSYLGGDYTTGEVTAIAASFGASEPAGTVTMHCWCLGPFTMKEMLSKFVVLYDQADIVTGHYLRKHDLPVLNGALIEVGMKPLGAKLVSDTKLDLVPIKYLSMSQESLGATFGLDEQKKHMTQWDWRQANRLEALHLTEERVTADVRQHMAMRKRLIELGALGPPRMWHPDKPGKT